MVALLRRAPVRSIATASGVAPVIEDYTIGMDPNIDATKLPSSAVPSPRSARTRLTTLGVAMTDAHVDGGAIVASMAPPSLA
jgi:hypothetical protein